MRGLLLVVMLATGCVHADRVAIVASSAAIICDGMQTLRMAGQNWVDDSQDHWEQNPLMGRKPSTTVVGAYFLGAFVINAALWVVTPPKYRAAAPLTITALETVTIVDNASRNRTGVCGL